MCAYGLADVFVEWPGRAADDPRTVLDIQETGCFALHGLHWQESFIAEEGRRRICHYRAPDAESVRIAFRQGGIPVDAVWSGTLLRRGGAIASGVLVESPFEPPWPDSAERAFERAERDWLRALGLQAARVIVPTGRRRILCFGALPAAGAQVTLPAGAWTCRHVSNLS